MLKINWLIKACVVGVTLIGLLIFQNCSKVAFSPDVAGSNSILGGDDDDTDTICNPLTGDNCTTDTGAGLKGNLYYLTAALHGEMFGNDLGTANLADYYAVGVKVTTPVVMSQINVSPRAWDTGFVTGAGDVVQANSNEKLFEWFALDLTGYIELPAGEYQLAQLSDDGMRVLVDGVTVLNDDGIHAPRWHCSSLTVMGGAKLPIRVGYFQGPRVQIAMQLFIRPTSKSSLPCGVTGEWEEVSASAFSH